MLMVDDTLAVVMNQSRGTQASVGITTLYFAKKKQ